MPISPEKVMALADLTERYVGRTLLPLLKRDRNNVIGSTAQSISLVNTA